MSAPDQPYLWWLVTSLGAASVLTTVGLAVVIVANRRHFREHFPLLVAPFTFVSLAAFGGSVTTVFQILFMWQGQDHLGAQSLRDSAAACVATAALGQFFVVASILWYAAIPGTALLVMLRPGVSDGALRRRVWAQHLCVWLIAAVCTGVPFLVGTMPMPMPGNEAGGSGDATTRNATATLAAVTPTLAMFKLVTVTATPEGTAQAVTSYGAYGRRPGGYLCWITSPLLQGLCFQLWLAVAVVLALTVLCKRGCAARRHQRQLARLPSATREYMSRATETLAARRSESVTRLAAFCTLFAAVWAAPFTCGVLEDLGLEWAAPTALRVAQIVSIATYGLVIVLLLCALPPMRAVLANVALAGRWRRSGGGSFHSMSVGSGSQRSGLSGSLSRDSRLSLNSDPLLPAQVRDSAFSGAFSGVGLSGGRGGGSAVLGLRESSYASLGGYSAYSGHSGRSGGVSGVSGSHGGAAGSHRDGGGQRGFSHGGVSLSGASVSEGGSDPFGSPTATSNILAVESSLYGIDHRRVPFIGHGHRESDRGRDGSRRAASRDSASASVSGHSGVGGRYSHSAQGRTRHGGSHGDSRGSSGSVLGQGRLSSTSNPVPSGDGADHDLGYESLPGSYRSSTGSLGGGGGGIAFSGAAGSLGATPGSNVGAPVSAASAGSLAGSVASRRQRDATGRHSGVRDGHSARASSTASGERDVDGVAAAGASSVSSVRSVAGPPGIGRDSGAGTAAGTSGFSLESGGVSSSPPRSRDRW